MGHHGHLCVRGRGDVRATRKSILKGVSATYMVVEFIRDLLLKTSIRDFSKRSFCFGKSLALKGSFPERTDSQASRLPPPSSYASASWSPCRSRQQPWCDAVTHSRLSLGFSCPPSAALLLLRDGQCVAQDHHIRFLWSGAVSQSWLVSRDLNSFEELWSSIW